MKRASLLVLTAIVAVLAAGCGGGGGLSKEDFEAEMSSVGQTLAGSFEDLASEAPKATSLDDLSAQLDTVESTLTDAAAKLESLDFPGDVEGAQAKLVDGVTALANDVKRLQDAVGSGDISSIEDVAKEFQNLDLSSLDTIQQAIEEIQSAGYDVGSSNG